MPPHDPSPCRLLVTAGPTHEPIDAVRYVANRSSGRMGIAIAAAAAARGLSTTLLLGPTALTPPETTGARLERFRTTEDLRRALSRHWPEHDVLVMAAAVADYRPVAPPGTEAGGRKIRRGERPLTLELEPTPDLLADLARRSRPDQRLIGFALEPAAELDAAARAKLARKDVDAIVANPLETMDAERVTAVLYLRDGEVRRPPEALPKAAFAEWLLDRLPELREMENA